MGGGREGDWECSGCKNRNYAFRTLCNGCKQPRLFVDTKTPSHSKWLPRIGDWICTGCTNNNYASREKCNKCGQPRKVTAMPAIAIHGGSIPTYSPYFARELGIAVAGNDVSGFVGNWPLSSIQNPILPIANSANQPLLVPKGWRNGDWICSCGFHNYSSRAQCKNCDASLPPALGTKRLASEESLGNFENKRLNSGNQHMHPMLNQIVGTASDPLSGAFAYPSFGLGLSANWQVPFPFSYQASTPAIIGKGAKHWRDGDWMCTNCNNHNYASRAQCNRCKTERDADSDPQTRPVSQTVDTT